MHLTSAQNTADKLQPLTTMLKLKIDL